MQGEIGWTRKIHPVFFSNHINLISNFVKKLRTSCRKLAL